jgi:ketosteroid isomerase-like protein
MIWFFLEQRACLYLSLIINKRNVKMNTEQQAILNVIEQMTNALTQKDVDGIMATYEVGATIIFEPEAPTSDPMAVRQKFIEMFAINPKFEYSHGHDVVVMGDTALHIAPWDMTGQLPDGTKIADTGLSVAVLRRQSDDSWLILMDNPYGSYRVKK